MTGDKGITLIELLVGMACFSIVVALVTGIFVTALSAKKQVKELSVLQDEARYIMDYITREVRTSEIKTGAGIKTNLEIKNANDENIGYKFLDTNIQRQNQNLNTVEIIDGYFDINKDANPAKIKIYMKLKKDNNELEVQTTISSRYYD